MDTSVRATQNGAKSRYGRRTHQHTRALQLFMLCRSCVIYTGVSMGATCSCVVNINLPCLVSYTQIAPILKPGSSPCMIIFYACSLANMKQNNDLGLSCT